MGLRVEAAGNNGANWIANLVRHGEVGKDGLRLTTFPLIVSAEDDKVLVLRNVRGQIVRADTKLTLTNVVVNPHDGVSFTGDVREENEGLVVRGNGVIALGNPREITITHIDEDPVEQKLGDRWYPQVQLGVACGPDREIGSGF